VHASVYCSRTAGSSAEKPAHTWRDENNRPTGRFRRTYQAAHERAAGRPLSVRRRAFPPRVRLTSFHARSSAEATHETTADARYKYVSAARTGVCLYCTVTIGERAATCSSNNNGNEKTDCRRVKLIFVGRTRGRNTTRVRLIARTYIYMDTHARTSGYAICLRFVLSRR